MTVGELIDKLGDLQDDAEIKFESTTGQELECDDDRSSDNGDHFLFVIDNA